MMLYDFVAFTKNMTSTQVVEMFDMPIRTVQALRQKVRAGAKDYALKNIDESKHIKFLMWKLEQVNIEIKKLEKKARKEAIKAVRALVVEFGITAKALTVRKYTRRTKTVQPIPNVVDE